MAVAQVFSEPPGRKYLLRQNLIAVTQARFLLAYSCAYGVLVRSMCVQASEIGVFTQSEVKADFFSPQARSGPQCLLSPEAV